MAREIERKFLVTGDAFRHNARATPIRQGYLSHTPRCTVRVRTAGPKGFLTIKGIVTGISRDEFEYEIPLADANHMLDTLCDRSPLSKTRHVVEYAGMTWEVDEFHGPNAGLIVAEVELEDESQKVDLPPWVGVEVTGEARYYNSRLFTRPYNEWTPDEKKP